MRVREGGRKALFGGYGWSGETRVLGGGESVTAGRVFLSAHGGKAFLRRRVSFGKTAAMRFALTLRRELIAQRAHTLCGGEENSGDICGAQLKGTEMWRGRRGGGRCSFRRMAEKPFCGGRVFLSARLRRWDFRSHCGGSQLLRGRIPLRRGREKQRRHLRRTAKRNRNVAEGAAAGAGAPFGAWRKSLLRRAGILSARLRRCGLRSHCGGAGNRYGKQYCAAPQQRAARRAAVYAPKPQKRQRENKNPPLRGLLFGIKIPENRGICVTY